MRQQSNETTECEIKINESTVLMRHDLPTPGWCVVWEGMVLATFQIELKDVAIAFAQSLCEIELTRALEHRWQ